MKTMKKIISLLLCCFLLFVFVSCGASVQGALNVDDATRKAIGADKKDVVIKVWSSSLFLIDSAEGRSDQEIIERVENSRQTDFQDECIYTESFIHSVPIYRNFSYYTVTPDGEITKTLLKTDDKTFEATICEQSIKGILSAFSKDTAFCFALSHSDRIARDTRIMRCDFHAHMSLGYYITYQTDQGGFVFFAPSDGSEWYLFPAEDFKAISRKMYDNVLEQTKNGMVFGGVALTLGLDLSEWQLKQS